MNTSGSLLALARRIVASVAALALGGCCREVGRFDQVVGASVLFPDGADGAIDDASCPLVCRRQFFTNCLTNELHSCGTVVADGGPGVRCVFTSYDCPPSPFGPCGRRTDGALREHARDTLVALVALEAEAVAAFERLANELSALGAPETLVSSARSCADDERRHVVMTSALDGRRSIAAPSGDRLALRGLFDVALENAVEGCVREAFGVLIAQWQAEASDDPRVRACYREIAQDEARHAALAFEVDRWLSPRLTSAEREAIEDAQRRAVESLRQEQTHARLDAWLGLPDASVSIALLEEFTREPRSEP